MKSTIGFLVKSLLITVLVLWLGLIIIEFIRFKNDEPMLFPIVTSEPIKYDDGYVYVYYGFGYKEIIYERESIYGKQFGHLFIKVKEELPEKYKGQSDKE